MFALTRLIKVCMCMAICAININIVCFADGTAKTNNLHQMALNNNGNYTEQITSPDSETYLSLRELAYYSDGIIVASIINARCYFDTKSNAIITDYTTKIKGVLMGDFHSGRTFVVSMPGGFVKFSDGATITQNIKFQKPLIENKTYLFFLKGIRLRKEGQEVTGGSQGIFELDYQSGKVLANNTFKNHSIVKKYNGISIDELLASVESSMTAVGKSTK